MIIYRHILAEHIAPFFYSIGLITFIFIMDLVIQLMDSILSKGLNPKVVLEVFVLNLAWMTALSIPMGVLWATLMAFGRFSADNEITALKASGVSLYRMITPPMVASVAICVGMIFFNNTILPESNHKASMLMSDIARKKPAAFIRSGTIISDFKGYRILIGRLDPKSSIMEDIKIYEEDREGNPSTTYAKRGRLSYIQDADYLQFALYDGETHHQDRVERHKYFVARFDTQVVNIKNTEHKLQRSSRKYRGDREMSSAMMLERVQGKKEERHKTARKMLEPLKKMHKIVLAEQIKGDTMQDSIGRAEVMAQLLARADLQFLLRNQQRRIQEQTQRNRLWNDQTRDISRFMVEVHKKYSIPFACLIFVLIGAPLGIKARTSGMGVGSAYSVAFFLLYWVCLIGGETLADKNIISAFWAMWAPNFLVGGFGVLLLIHMVRETTFISYRWMGRWAKRIGLVSQDDTTQSDDGSFGHENH